MLTTPGTILLHYVAGPTGKPHINPVIVCDVAGDTASGTNFYSAGPTSTFSGLKVFASQAEGIASGGIGFLYPCA